MFDVGFGANVCRSIYFNDLDTCIDRYYEYVHMYILAFLTPPKSAPTWY